MANEPPENESMLGVLIVLFLVVVSTIYVFSQQRGPPLANGAQRGGRAGFPGAPPAVEQYAANAVPTANLSEQQLRLHRSLPSRHGGRAITICVDAVVKNKTDASGIAWASEDTPRVLADLLLVADVYLLCKLESDDAQAREHIQRFLTALEVSTKTRSLKKHKILFCTTSIGAIAFVRQIEPQVHVEVDASVVRDLEKHVPRIVHVVPTLDAAPGPGMHHITDSFATYFDLLSTM